MRRPRPRVFVPLVALFILWPVGSAVRDLPSDFFPAGDRPRLQDEQRKVLALVSETISIVAPGSALGPYAGHDTDDPFGNPNDSFGYDRCDYWWNRFVPGWQAGLWYDFPVAGEVERSAIVTAVRDLWARQPGTLTETEGTSAIMPLRLEDGSAGYVLRFDGTQRLGTIAAGTRCLPLE
jgi:hypothetical protein